MPPESFKTNHHDEIRILTPKPPKPMHEVTALIQPGGSVCPSEAKSLTT